MATLHDRAVATQKTVDRFIGKPFGWGRFDCAKMARRHLLNMGHKPPRIGQYQSAIGAARVLRDLGHDTLEQMLDGLGLLRIAPAQMLIGDIALMQSAPDDLFDAIVIGCGAKMFGWHDDAPGAVMIVPMEIKAAWRV